VICLIGAGVTSLGTTMSGKSPTASTPTPVTAFLESKHAPLALTVVGLTLLVIGLAVSAPGGAIQNLYFADALAPTVLYTESPYTNMQRGVDRLCAALAEENGSNDHANWVWAAKAYDDAHAKSKVTMESLMGKARLWPNPHSGVEGRDRVLCAGTNHDPNVDRIALLYHKWAHLCDVSKIYTPASDIGRDVPRSVQVEMHPFGGDELTGTAVNNWQRFIFMIRDLARSPRLNDVDWVLVFGDDAYVSVPNLKAMLREPWFAEMDRLGVPLVLGHRMISGGSDIFVANSAFVLNVMVVRILDSLFASQVCDPTLTASTDDIPLAHCLARVGIYAFDSYDINGQDRFSPFHPAQVADLANDPSINSWYPGYRNRPMPRHTDALSSFPVAYHYMDLAAVDSFDSKIRASSAKSSNGFD
jgi:hypothetical protein